MKNPAREKFLPLLSPYVDGELSPEERKQVEQHLANNKESASQVADFRAGDALIRHALEMQADQVDWKDFSDEVMGKLTPEKLPLFERVGNRLQPTVEAKAIYNDAEPLRAMSEAIGGRIRDLRDTKRGHFRILSTHALGRTVVARALAAFLKSRDDVQVFFDVRRMEGVIESVESGFADIGIAIAPAHRPGMRIDIVAESNSQHKVEPWLSQERITTQPGAVAYHMMAGPAVG